MLIETGKQHSLKVKCSIGQRHQALGTSLGKKKKKMILFHFARKYHIYSITRRK